MNTPLLRQLAEIPWAIWPSSLHEMVKIIRPQRQEDRPLVSDAEVSPIWQSNPGPWQAAIDGGPITITLNASTPDGLQVEHAINAATRRRQRSVKGSVSVLPVRGVISHRRSIMDFFGGTSIEALGQWFDAAMADSDVGAVVFDIDSPGGSVFGLPELHTKIMDARGTKPVIAVANAMAASAAYFVASAADEVVVTPSGWLGSVGTVMLHMDFSKAFEEMGIKPSFIFAGKYKTEGNPYEPIDDEARDRLQQEIDGYYDQFVGAVARGRGTTKAAVKRDYGQGRMLLADEAVQAGVADRIASLDQVLSELGVSKTAGPDRGRRAERTPDDADSGIDIRRRRAKLRDRCGGAATRG